MPLLLLPLLLVVRMLAVVLLVFEVVVLSGRRKVVGVSVSYEVFRFIEL